MNKNATTRAAAKEKEEDQLQRVCFQMGISYLRSHADQEAMVLFNGLFVLFPKNIHVAALTALARLRCKEAKGALEITEKLVRVRHVKSSFWFMHAKALLQLGRKRESSSAFQQYMLLRRREEQMRKDEQEPQKQKKKDGKALRQRMREDA